MFDCKFQPIFTGQQRNHVKVPGAMIQDVSILARITQFILLILSLAMGLMSPAFAQTPPNTGASSNVQITLKSARANVVPGETFYLAIEQKIARDWHTYWRNPGDSGEATRIEWTLPQGVTAGPILWPAPSALPFGPLVNYGFSDQVTLPVAISVPASAKIGDRLEFVADVAWLECADICIPGQAKVDISVMVAASASDSPYAKTIATTLESLPKAFQGSTRLTDIGTGGLQLVINGIDTPRNAYFFPYEIKNGALIDFAQPQELVAGKDGFGLSLVKSPSFPTDLAGPIEGVLVLGKGSRAQAFEVKAEFEIAPASAAYKSAPPPARAVSTPSIGLVLALGMAFLGGLILNLMPCVFPILSMKALSLIEASHSDRKSARAHGLWYGAGVIASFLALAGVLIVAKSAGAALGWGFQLQNPLMVVALAMLMTMIGFNFLGFFEIGTSLQNIGGGKARGSFLTGVLAVVVAAPCTAPFMGAALGFAAGQSAPIALLVFAALGLGMAFPFVALTFAPALLAALPKPGRWMVKLREALAFPMFATAIWLIWVASAQAGQAGVLAALVCILAAGLCIWTLRTWKGVTSKAIAGAIVSGAVVWAGFHLAQVPSPTSQARATGGFGQAWSAEEVAALRAQGKTVFVNFTADWCVTCKVNELGAFTDPRVQAALSGEKANYLIADWTSRDNAIAEALASHGRIGVPLYLVYKPGIEQPVILPQLLSADMILEALN
jgi:thiol:disulfide interchange protein/DsbC/DsbD-like thiol-disulfide interchange protein